MPVSAAATQPRATMRTSVATTQKPNKHALQKGETLWGISKKYQVSLQDLQKANPLLSDPSRVRIGTELVIPASKAPSAAAAAPAATRTPASPRTQNGSRIRARVAERQRAARLTTSNQPALSQLIAKGGVLKKGASGAAVRELQKNLGLPQNQQDGFFGPVTEQALRAAQKSKGITADGILGPQTFAALGGKPAPARAVPTASPQVPKAPANTPGKIAPMNIRYQSQLDNRVDRQGRRGNTQCFSSASAMFASNQLGRHVSDESYNRIREKIGDSTNPQVQVKALRQMGVNARFVQNADRDTIRQELAKGNAVPVGFLQKGSSSRPYGGHWATIVGMNERGYIVNDPFGSLDVKTGAYDNGGKHVVYPYEDFDKRWQVEGKGSGWAMLAS